MSLIRTGITPDAWRDEGPAHHVPHGHGIRGNTQSGYIPFVRLPMIQSEAERSRQRRRVVLGIRPNRPVCGVVMAVVGEPCARMAGHKDSHRSRAVMDADARGRWAGTRKP